MEQIKTNFPTEFVILKYRKEYEDSKLNQIQDPAIITPLERSRQLLFGISNHNKLNNPDINQNQNLELNSCTVCQRIVASKNGNECTMCCKFFCLKHRQEINHNCEKLPKEKEMYLLAKNKFRNKLREIKKL